MTSLQCVVLRDRARNDATDPARRLLLAQVRLEVALAHLERARYEVVAARLDLDRVLTESRLS